ncbi:hypothetical protein JYU34_019464 [Plutella xylostella]|uniref:Uncharacterized protein n=1 Tax=Plutella xylostella TaxID=51655 RepID=A0ABQ7PWV7_PLUXY|nr:hypothetical protein JYU34_019464 [Plutella xylostella]
MTEQRVSFLYKAAAVVPNTTEHQNHLLKSFYLIRCHELTKSHRLPTKQFSSNLRCSYCCNEWKVGFYETKISAVKLSKKQRQRIKRSKETIQNKTVLQKKKELLHSNQIERFCLICKHKSVIPTLKPEKSVNKIAKQTPKASPTEAKNNPAAISKSVSQVKPGIKKKLAVNVYSNTQEVFSLKNKNNTITSTIKEAPKVIKNNKKKKDKFAGLCKEAVLASSKLKNKDKLNLFLKPST